MTTYQTMLGTNGGTVAMGSTSNLLMDKGTGTSTGGTVTINNQGCVITTPSITTAAGSTYSITLTDSVITNIDLSTVGGFVISGMGGSNTREHYNQAALTTTLNISIYNTSVNPFNGTIILGVIFI